MNIERLKNLESQITEPDQTGLYARWAFGRELLTYRVGKKLLPGELKKIADQVGRSRLLRQGTTQGRAVLQRVLHGRIIFTPDRDGYVFSAPTRFDKLFTGIMSPRPAFISADDLSGTEGIGAEDTHDADYGRLLERAAQKYVKWVASPGGCARVGAPETFIEGRFAA